MKKTPHIGTGAGMGVGIDDRSLVPLVAAVLTACFLAGVIMATLLNSAGQHRDHAPGSTEDEQQHQQQIYDPVPEPIPA